jgi:hypothetical protein
MPIFHLDYPTFVNGPTPSSQNGPAVQISNHPLVNNNQPLKENVVLITNMNGGSVNLPGWTVYVGDGTIGPGIKCNSLNLVGNVTVK